MREVCVTCVTCVWCRWRRRRRCKDGKTGRKISKGQRRGVILKKRGGKETRELVIFPRWDVIGQAMKYAVVRAGMCGEWKWGHLHICWLLFPWWLQRAVSTREGWMEVSRPTQRAVLQAFSCFIAHSVIQNAADERCVSPVMALKPVKPAVLVIHHVLLRPHQRQDLNHAANQQTSNTDVIKRACIHSQRWVYAFSAPSCSLAV